MHLEFISQKKMLTLISLCFVERLRTLPKRTCPSQQGHCFTNNIRIVKPQKFHCLLQLQRKTSKRVSASITTSTFQTSFTQTSFLGFSSTFTKGNTVQVALLHQSHTCMNACPHFSLDKTYGFKV